MFQKCLYLSYHCNGACVDDSAQNGASEDLLALGYQFLRPLSTDSQQVSLLITPNLWCPVPWNLPLCHIFSPSSCFRTGVLLPGCPPWMHSPCRTVSDVTHRPEPWFSGALSTESGLLAQDTGLHDRVAPLTCSALLLMAPQAPGPVILPWSLFHQG